MQKRFHFATISNEKDIKEMLKKDKVISLNQVHGNGVLAIDKERNSALNFSQLKKQLNYDGLVTNQKEIFLIIKHADCAPVFLFDNFSGEIIGLLHCGWRSVQKDIIFQAKKIIEKKFQFREKIFFTIGPMICKKCYLVKKDLVVKFTPLIKKYGLKSKKYFSSLKTSSDEFFFDLKILIHDICLKNGFCHWKNSSICTKEDLVYFSYRRNKTSKRNISYIIRK